MKYTLIFICFLISSATIAQVAKYDMDAEVQKIKLKYKMDDGQASQVKTLLQDKLTALTNLSNNKASDEKFAEKKQTLLDDYEKSFVGILNEDQIKLHKMYQRLTLSLDKEEKTFSHPGMKNGGVNSPVKKAANQ